MGVIIFFIGLLLGGCFGAIMMGLVIADREPKVRCKHCDYTEHYVDGDTWCAWFNIDNKPNDFCSWGRKREDEG